MKINSQYINMMQRQYINLMQRREQCSQHNFIAFHDLRQKFFYHFDTIDSQENHCEF